MNAPQAISAKDYASPEKLKEFKTLSDTQAWLNVFRCWLVIIITFTVVALFPNPLTIVLAVILLGGSQLSLGGLLHDCSHRAMFTHEKLNDWVGNWLGGIPVLVPMSFYRQYHFIHHTQTGHDVDPDVNNIRNYPVTRSSMIRKVIRDFTGQSGIKSIIGVLFYVNTGKAGDSGSMGNNQSEFTKRQQLLYTIKNFAQILVVHGVFFSCLYALNVGWLYGLWWLAYLFTHPFILRVRQIGEHGAMASLSSQDVRNTTRTTLATWWERLLFAPNNINYHCEHHLYPTVPAYNLKKIHDHLLDRGFYKDYPSALEPSYWAVIKRASAKR